MPDQSALVSPRLAEVRYRIFWAEIQPLMAAADQSQHLQRSMKRVRPTATLVTGYLILDDSTHVKRYVKGMGGQG